MNRIKSAMTVRWWVVTGIAMGAGVAVAHTLGVPLLVAVLFGGGAPFVGAFSHVLAGDGQA